MFRFFNKKTTQEFTVDERQELIQDYLHKAESVCSNYTYNYKGYLSGGVQQLKELIANLQTISDRIDVLETIEMIEHRTNFEKILDNSSKK